MLQTKSKPHKYLSMVGYSIIHLLTWAFYVCGFSIKMRNCTILILWHLVADFLPFFCTSYTLVQAAEAKVHYCYFSCIFMFVCLFLIAESQYVCTLSSQIHLLLSVQVISVFGKERTCIIPFSYKFTYQWFIRLDQSFQVQKSIYHFHDCSIQTQSIHVQ